MSENDIVKTDDTSVMVLTIGDVVENNRTALINLYLRILREEIFEGRIELRPSMIKPLAEKEADYLLYYLRNGLPSTINHGVELCQSGLTHRAVIRLCRAARNFFTATLDQSLVPTALDIAEEYQLGVIDGFMMGRERLILDEQERIRNAVDRTLSKATVEIKHVQDMAQHASEISRFKSRLIAQVSHELRTPLGGLLGLTEILEQQILGPLNPKQMDLTHRIINNANILNHLLASLLDQSHIESGKMLLKGQPFSPRNMAQTVHSNQLPFALHQGLALQLKINPSLPEMVTGDEVRSTQILTNLVNNAIKYTNEGRIVMSLYPVDENYWAMEVTDTGIGIAENVRETIFEPFQRVDLEGMKAPGGVGLGLSIVKQLVEAMNGRVSLISEMGMGSTFTVVLPSRFVPITTLTN